MQSPIWSPSIFAIFLTSCTVSIFLWIYILEMHLPCSPRYFCQAYLSINMFARAGNRETIKGWPLLTVETEVNGDSKYTSERGPSLVGLVVLVQEFFGLPLLL